MVNIIVIDTLVIYMEGNLKQVAEKFIIMGGSKKKKQNCVVWLSSVVGNVVKLRQMGTPKVGRKYCNIPSLFIKGMVILTNYQALSPGTLYSNFFFTFQLS